jgi:hypothetical protein
VSGKIYNDVNDLNALNDLNDLNDLNALTQSLPDRKLVAAQASRTTTDEPPKAQEAR